MAKILKTHEVNLFKVTWQAKYFFKESNLSIFDIDKDVNHEGELVPEVQVEGVIEKPTKPVT